MAGLGRARLAALRRDRAAGRWSRGRLGAAHPPSCARPARGASAAERRGPHALGNSPLLTLTGVAGLRSLLPAPRRAPAPLLLAPAANGNELGSALRPARLPGPRCIAHAGG